MEWQKPFTKLNGALRKQFRSWAVPSEISEIQDGDELDLEAEYKGGSFSGIVRITSGREFNLPKAIAEEVARTARETPEWSILFRLAGKNSSRRSFFIIGRIA